MSIAAATKPRREDLPKDVNLCEYCTAKCCHYFALPIDTPNEPRDYDFIRWYLIHEHATVFTEDDDWYLLVHTTCKHLRSDYMCGIYETRPQICRDYSTDICEYEDDWTYERYFEVSEQFEEYYEALLADSSKNIRSRKPPLLPVIR